LVPWKLEDELRSVNKRSLRSKAKIEEMDVLQLATPI